MTHPRGGDQRFDRLFAEHFAAVQAYVTRRVGDDADRDDVLAETFLVAWRRAPDVPPEPLPWLLGVARRVIANQRRSGHRRTALIERLRPGVNEEAADSYPLVGLSAELRHALARLSEREREAILLVAWEGLEPTAAARVVGCSAAAFRVRLHRARRRLAEGLAEGLADPEEHHMSAPVVQGARCPPKM